MSSPESLNDFMERCHAFLDGELSPDEEIGFLALVKANPEYESILNSLKGVHDQLTALPQTDPPEGLETRILEAVASEHRSTGTVAKSPGWFPSLKVAAAFLLVATVGLTVYFKADPDSSGEKRVAVNSGLEVVQPKAVPDKKMLAVPDELGNPDSAVDKGDVAQSPTSIKTNETNHVQAQPAITDTPREVASVAPEDVQLEADLQAFWQGMDSAQNEMVAMEEQVFWVQSDIQ